MGNDTVNRIVNDYLIGKFGENYVDVLTIAENIADGRAPKTFDPEFLDSFGGASALNDVIAANVTGAQLKDAESHAPAIVRTWDKAAGKGSLMEPGSMRTGEDLMRMVGDLVGQASGQGDDPRNARDMERLREIDKELSGEVSEYTRARLAEEKSRLSSSLTSRRTASMMPKVREGDAKQLTALIVALGKDCLPTDDIWDAIVNG